VPKPFITTMSIVSFIATLLCRSVIELIDCVLSSTGNLEWFNGFQVGRAEW